ncbi:unnamed protein product [Penicillium salamii]|nr:unnamed protein product [Penicillium salamii]CAG8271424.1 unnamed protein product [Penicillium salamii]
MKPDFANNNIYGSGRSQRRDLILTSSQHTSMSTAKGGSSINGHPREDGRPHQSKPTNITDTTTNHDVYGVYTAGIHGVDGVEADLTFAWDPGLFIKL